MSWRSDVSGEELDAATGLAHDTGRLLGVLVLVQIADHDVGPLAREGHRDRATDAAVAPGDDRGSVLKETATFVAVLAEVGSRVHLSLAAGVLLLRLRERRLRPGLFRMRLFFVGHVSAPALHREPAGYPPGVRTITPGPSP